MARQVIAAVAALVLGSCNRHRHNPPPPPPLPAPALAPQGSSASPRLDAADAALQPLLAGHQQLIIAIVEDWHSTTAVMSRWQRHGDQPWASAGDAWRAVVGKSGVAWGAGIHDADNSAFANDPRKSEGDGKAPAGAFLLMQTTGYAAQPTGRLPYTHAQDSLRCVDDSNSAHYNQIVDEKIVRKDWTSAEEMKRSDELYQLVIEVGHNPARSKQAGSCIFLHIWREVGSPTVGCTAMAKPVLEQLLGWLDPKQRPVYVLLPRLRYSTVAKEWGLPPAATLPML